MKHVFLNNIPKVLSLILILFFLQGCGTTIYMYFESDPSGAEIYAGPAPNQFKYLGRTPKTMHFKGLGPYWREEFYQFKKEGYYDSGIIHAEAYPPNTNRRVYAKLEPIPPQPKQQPISPTPEPKDAKKTIKITTGTAFFINEQGNLLSNYHVVKDCKNIMVRNAFCRGKARLLFTDEINDLAVLIVERIFPPATGYFRSGKSLRLGDDIITIGYPLSPLLGESAKVTKGNVTSMTGFANDSRMLQISAPIQPGSSGGPLLDNNGNVVGIVSAKLNELVMLKATGSLPQNINFAIKSQTIEMFLLTHRIKYLSQDSNKKYETADIVEKAEKFTVQIMCME